MAFIVKVAGPTFESLLSRQSFSRIEDSIRQFSVHSRESFAIVRQPFSIDCDHFVLVWSRGTAIVALLPLGGRIRANAKGKWTSEEARESELVVTPFSNPFKAMEAVRNELQTVLNQAAEQVGLRTEIPASGDAASINREIQLIALCARPIERVQLDPTLRRTDAELISIDAALTRTLEHIPTLLRLADRGPFTNSTAKIEAAGVLLERLATLRRTERPAESTPEIESTSKRPRWRWQSIAFASPIIIVIGLTLILLLEGKKNAASSLSTPKAHSHNLSEANTLALRLPEPYQVVIAHSKLTTRTELDSLLYHGDAIRLLPDTLQLVQFDRTKTFAPLFAYLKIQNQWRRGISLFPNQVGDTITIDSTPAPLH